MLFRDKNLNRLLKVVTAEKNAFSGSKWKSRFKKNSNRNRTQNGKNVSLTCWIRWLFAPVSPGASWQRRGVCVCLFAFGFSIFKSLFICSLRVLFASCAARDKLVQFFPPSADYRQFCFVTFTFASFLNTLKHFLYLSYFFVAIISCNLLLLNFPRAWSFNARHTFSPFFVTILLLLPLQECVWVVGCVCDCECCCCFLYSSVLAGGCCFVLCLLRTVKRINLCLFFVVTYWLFWIRLLFFLQCWWFYRIVL